MLREIKFIDIIVKELHDRLLDLLYHWILNLLINNCSLLYNQLIYYSINTIVIGKVFIINYQFQYFKENFKFIDVLLIIYIWA